MKKIPLRYRLIALGFVSHMSLEQLENKLKENDCEQLYARNFTEASLIYAFYNGLSYSQWVQLESLSRKKMIEEKKDLWFNDSTVTYGDLFTTFPQTGWKFRWNIMDRIWKLLLHRRTRRIPQNDSFQNVKYSGRAGLDNNRHRVP